MAGGIFAAQGENRFIDFDWTRRDAAFNNEIGLYIVDDTSGRIGNIKPSDAGYAAAALQRSDVIFRSGQGTGARTTRNFSTDTLFGVYLVQNATTSRASQGNPNNRLGQGPLTFFSVTSANPDGVEHVRSSSTGVNSFQFSFEDMTGGGDRDFNDAIIRVGPRSPQISRTPAASVKPVISVPGRATQTVQASFDWVSRNAAANNELGIFRVDDASGKIGSLLPTSPGYLQAALQSAHRQVIFASGQTAGAAEEVTLPGGSFFGMYLVFNGTTAQAIAGQRQAYLSLPQANADGFDHIRDLGNGMAAWEDLPGGGDRDFNDMVVQIQFAVPQGGETPEETIPHSVSIQLEEDTGTSSTDRITKNATVTGTANDASGVAKLEAGFLIAGATNFQDVTSRLQNGSFTFDRSLLSTLNGGALPDGAYALQVRATDNKGSRSQPVTLSFTLDTTIALPTLDLASNFDSSPIGDKATTFSNVTLEGSTDRDNKLRVIQTGAETTADTQGAFSFTNVALAMGANPFRVVASDVAGNEAERTETFTRTLPPAEDEDAPLTSLRLVNDTGSSNADGITFDPSISASITDASPVTKVELAFDSNQPNAFRDATSLLSGTSLSMTRTQLESLFGSSLTDKAYTLYLRAADAFNNVSTPISLAFTLDTTLATPTLNLEAASDTGTVGDRTTVKETVILVGVTDPNASVALDGVTLPTTSGANGSFTFTGVNLALGANGMSAVATDIAGNQRFVQATFTREPCDFEDNLAGWTVSQSGGGTSPGTVTAEDCLATLREGDSFVVELAKDVTISAQTKRLLFTYADLNFDKTDASFINDAFEVALVDQDGFSLLPTYTTGRDAFFNITEDLPAAIGGTGIVTVSGDTVTVNLSGVPIGSEGTLIFRLVNNDDDTASSVRLTKARFENDPVPPPVGTKFYVADVTAGVFRHAEDGSYLGSFASGAPSKELRGASSIADGSSLWTIATDGTVLVQKSDGTLRGSWTAYGAVDPEGLEVVGADVWVVDASLKQAIRYSSTSGNIGGIATASSFFNLASANASPTGIASDGMKLFVTDDLVDAVFVYSLAGTLLGQWSLDPANADASDLTTNPAGGTDLWVLDRIDMKVYAYLSGTTLTSGTWTATSSFALNATNVKPEGLADPPVEQSMNPGRIIAIGDEWLLSDRAFTLQNEQTMRLLEKIASYFSPEGGGNFLAASVTGPTSLGARGVNGSLLANAARSLGHNWIVDPFAEFSLLNLSNYDAVFLTGSVGSGPTNAAVLAEYVRSGGSILVMAGTAEFGNAATEAAAWNVFLNQFGLAFGSTWFGPFADTIPISPNSHPLSGTLDSAYWGFGQLAIDLDESDPRNEVAVRGDFRSQGGAFGSINDIIAVFNVPSSITGTQMFPPTISVSSPVSTALPGKQILISGNAVADSGGRSLDEFVIGGFDAVRTDGLSISDGDSMEELRTAIRESFPRATFHSTTELTSEYLAQVDVVMLTAFSDSDAGVVLSLQEQDALRAYFSAGGDALLFTDNNFTQANADANRSLLQLLGMSSAGAQSNANVNTVVIDPQSHPVTNGPFGIVSTYTTHFTGWFDELGPYALPLATLSTNGQSALAVIPENAMSSGSGRIVVFNDISMLIEGSPAHGPMSAENRRLVLNSFAYAADTVPVTAASVANRIVSVEINGTAVDVLDANGNFFAAVNVNLGENRYRFTAYDSVGQAVSTEVVITGTQATSATDLSRYDDITGTFEGVYYRTSFDDRQKRLYVDLATKNKGAFEADVPLLVGVRNISDPTVKLLGFDGLMPDGTPYVDFSRYVEGQRLGADEETSAPSIVFENPTRAQFDYELVFYAKLNEAPEITTVPDIEALAGRTYRYDINARDADGDTLTYSFENNLRPVGMAIDPATGLITWSPTTDQIGNHDVVVLASDNRGGVSRQRYVLSVIPAPPNRPPVITSVPMTIATAAVGSSAESIVNVSTWQALDVSENANPPQWQIAEDGLSAITLINGSPTALLSDFNFANERIRGSWRVETNSDNDFVGFVFGFKDSQNFYLFDWKAGDQVSDYGDLGLAGMSVKRIAADSVLTDSDLWTTAGIPGRVTSLFHNDIGWGSFTDYEFDLSAVEGQFIITVRQGGTVLATIDIADPSFRPGRFGFYNNSQERVRYQGFRRSPISDLGYHYDIEAVDSDGDPLTFSLLTSPAGMSINSGSGVIRWSPQPDQIGQHTVKVEVIDGRGGIATQEFIVCVEPDPTNHAPIVTSDPINNAIVGQPYSYDVDAFDPDDDEPIYSLVDSPEGMTIDAQSGVITWTPPSTSNLLRNGGFEIVPTPAVTDQGVTPSEWLQVGTLTPGADTYSVTGDFGVSPGFFGVWSGVSPHGGSRWVAGAQFGSAGGIEAIGQELTQALTPGHQYRVSANILQSSRPSSDRPGTYRVLLSTTPSLSADMVELGEFSPTTNSDSWEARSFNFIAPNNSASLPFIIFAPKAFDANDVYIAVDDVLLVDLDGVAPTVTVRASDNRGGFDEQTFTIEVKAPGTGEIRGTVGDSAAFVEQVVASSTFDINADGWTFDTNAASNFSYQSNGGNTGGFLRFTDVTNPGSWFVAPAKYLGDWSSLDNLGTLSFDHKIFAVGGTPSAFGNYGARLSGPGGTAEWVGTVAPSSMTPWVTQAIPIVQESWSITSGTWDALLENVSELLIKGELIRNETNPRETTGIDNVRLIAFESPGLASWQLYLDLNNNAQLDLGEPTTLTDTNGDYAFTGLPAGTYIVREEPQPGWRQTYPSSPSVAHAVTLVADQVVAGVDFGNTQLSEGPNQNPQFSSMAPLQTTFGELFRYDVIATDADNDPLSFSLITSPAGMTLNPQTGTVVWQPQEPQLGEHTVTLRATDGRGGVALQQFTLAVISPNTAPVFTSEPARQALQGRPFVYDIAVQDADRELVTVTLEPGSVGTLTAIEVRGPSNELLQTRYRLTWTPSASDLTVGKGTIKLKATDESGGSSLQIADVTVVATATNAAPVITSTPRIIARPGIPYGYAVTATDANADPLIFSLDPILRPDGMTISATGLILWTPSLGITGAHPVRVLVSDGTATAVQEFSITIASELENQSPIIVSNPPQSAREGKLYSYGAIVNDADGDPVTWQLDAAPVGMSLDSQSGAVRWTPRSDQMGAHQVVLRATDPFGASTLQSFAIDVRCVNTPPLILSTPPTQAAVDEAYFYGVRANDVDGDPLTFSLIGSPAGMSISPNGLIRWTPVATDQGQTRSVVVRASDGDGGFAIQEYSIEVTAATSLNRAPTITSSPTFAATVEDIYQYQVDATDPDGDTLVYALVVKPSWMSIDSATGLISGTPTSAGVESVVVEVSDGTAKALQGFAVNVRLNQAPTITSSPALGSTVGDTYRYTVRASDPDGDPLSYSLIAGPSGMTIDGFGRIIWKVPVNFPTANQVEVRLQVSDPRGALASQNYFVTIAADTTAPSVFAEVQVSNRFLSLSETVDLNSPLTIRVSAYDSVGVVRRALEVDGELVALNDQGEYALTAHLLGPITLVAKAYDAAGNEGVMTRILQVVNPTGRGGNTPNVSDPTLPERPTIVPGDSTAPNIVISNPLQDASVTTLTPIIGTIDDAADNLWFWRAYVVRTDLIDLANFNLNDPDLRQIGQGTTEIQNAEITTFDPSSLSNDPYAIVVVAFDATGNGNIAVTTVGVEGNLKIGQFRLEFTDLSIPLAGIPIEITRVYDTHDAARQGDFGYGWTLGVKDARIIEVGITNDFETLTPDKTKIYLTNPSGQRIGFTYKERFKFGTLFGPIFAPYFQPDPGVYDTLTVDESEVTRGGLLGALGGEGINPDVYTLTTADGTKYRYHQRTGLETIIDLNGNVVTFTDGGIKHSSGTEVKFVRDTRGRITEIIDPAGHKLLYSYNAAGDLASFTSQAALMTSFTYRTRPAHYLDEIKDPLGRRAVKTEYDDQGRMLRTIDAAGNVVEYDHSLDGFERIRDAAGNWTSLKYDPFGNVVEERRGEHKIMLPSGGEQTVYDSIVRTRYIHERDGVTSPNRDKEWKVTQVYLDDLGNTIKEFTTEYDYDARGNATKVTDVVGGQTMVREYSFDAKNNVTRVKDELGRETFFTYDSAGNLRDVVNAEGNKASTQYDAQGRVTSYTDFNSNTTTFVYMGSQSQPSEIRNPGHTDASPNLRKFEYNSFGQTTKITDEEGIITEYEYDNQGRTIYERVGTDAPVRSIYQGQNLHKRIVARSEVEPGASDIVTEYGYTATDLTKYEIDALGAVTGYEYDANRNRTFLGRWNSKADYDADMAAKASSPATVFAGRFPKATFEHVFVYDRMNRVDYELDDVQLALAEQGGIPLDQITVRLDYEYDSVGNQTEVIDRNGRKRTFEYDERNRKVAELWWQIDVGSGQEEVIRSFTWQYCTCGNISQATEYDGVAGTSPILSRYTYTYDTLGRMTSVDNAGTKDMPNIILSYSYDANGNQTRVEDSLGVAVVSTYDAQNRLKTRAWDNKAGINPANAVDEVLVEFDYYKNGTQKELRRYDLDDTSGARTLVGRTLHGNLDASGRVRTISHRDAVDQAIAEYMYGFDKLGLVKSLLYDNRDDQYDFDVAYGYDDLGQLVEADYKDATEARGIYQDEFYNYDKNGNRVSSHLHGRGYRTGSGNRLLSDGTFNYEYDNDGNQIRKTDIATGEVTVYEYDYRNLMTRATRYSKAPESGGVILAESTNRYDIEGRRIAFSTDEDGISPAPPQHIRVFYNMDDTWADISPSNTLLTRYLLSDRIDSILARYSTSVPNNSQTWILNDAIGTIRDTFDYAISFYDHTAFDSFGQILLQSNTGDSDRFFFTGREHTSSTGLHYYRARYLHSATGRFLSEDPLKGLLSGASSYSYVQNRPTYATDPSGSISIIQFSILATVVAIPVSQEVIGVLFVVYDFAKIIASLQSWTNPITQRHEDIPSGFRDNPEDAYYHAFGACSLAKGLGGRAAILIGDIYERYAGGTERGTAMDRRNNRIGASLAERGDCLTTVLNALENGDLTYYNREGILRGRT